MEFHDIDILIYFCIIIVEFQKKAGKYSYVERNFEMIDNSMYCVFYYNENYITPLKGGTKHNIISSMGNSGTKTAYEYAMKKKKVIINLYK